MATFTQTQLLYRGKILQSHANFIKFFDKYTIHALVNLFNTKCNTCKDKITTYLAEERSQRGLHDDNVIINSEVYGTIVGNTGLNLTVKKDNKDYVHLSIHLTFKSLKPQQAGIIHIYKDFYESLDPNISKKKLYALILVVPSQTKPNTLEFSIADGYNTPNIENAAMYDVEMQKEMDSILSVLNNLFDEDNEEFYIGSPGKIIHIHNKVNSVLTDLNSHSKYATRRNKCKLMFNTVSNNISMRINMSKNKPKPKKNPSRASRKVIKKCGNYV